MLAARLSRAEFALVLVGNAIRLRILLLLVLLLLGGISLPMCSNHRPGYGVCLFTVQMLQGAEDRGREFGSCNEMKIGRVVI